MTNIRRKGIPEGRRTNKEGAFKCFCFVGMGVKAFTNGKVFQKDVAKKRENKVFFELSLCDFLKE